ncbi:MAG TPA: shikimate dehydrogenase [bacterium]|nr:shikimate dehydrogenase [bacterium]
MIDARTTVCCIIGDPVEHSLSPAMHNAAYEALGLNWVYVAFPVKLLPSAVAGVRALGIRGVSVTIPHKVAVIPLLDKLDPVAEWIGSVNTIVNNDGELTGMNTDGAGAMKALGDAGVELKGKRVLILGSGGAARAIAITLAARARIKAIDLLGVIEDELKSLHADVRARTGIPAEWAMMGPDSLKAAIKRADLVIHCTPVGMHPKEGETVVPAEMWRSELAVMDIVYNPRETLLLQEARAAGCKIVYGFEMLLDQGILQFEAWTGSKAPEEVMRKALTDWMAER